MSREIILESLKRCGATIEGEKENKAGQITKQDLMELGLSGCPEAGSKRLALLKKLNLPERLTANGMLEALNLLYDRESLLAVLEEK